MVSIADIAHLPTIGTYSLDCQRIIDDCSRDAQAAPTYVFVLTTTQPSRA